MESKALYLLMALLTVLALVFVGLQFQKAEEARQAALIAQMREYDGKINGSWVEKIEDIGAVTAGTVSDDGKSLTLSFMPNDIAYGRNERLAYFVIDIHKHIRDIKVDGSRVSDAVDVIVAQDSPGVVYTDPEDLKDSVAAMTTAIDVKKDGDFDFEIPVDTYNIDVEKIYVGLKFKLASEPENTVSATKIYNIDVEAGKADSDYYKFTLSVLAQYNVTS